MKLKFLKSDQGGFDLSVVECDSLAEAEEFKAWFEKKVTPNENSNLEVEKPAEKSNPKVTRNDVSQAAIALVQTKGRQALEPILQRYEAKRISEIPEDKLADAFQDIKEAS